MMSDVQDLIDRNLDNHGLLDCENVLKRLNVDSKYSYHEMRGKHVSPCYCLPSRLFACGIAEATAYQNIVAHCDKDEHEEIQDTASVHSKTIFDFAWVSKCLSLDTASDFGPLEPPVPATAMDERIVVGDHRASEPTKVLNPVDSSICSHPRSTAPYVAEPNSKILLHGLNNLNLADKLNNSLTLTTLTRTDPKRYNIRKQNNRTIKSRKNGRSSAAQKLTFETLPLVLPNFVAPHEASHQNQPSIVMSLRRPEPSDSRSRSIQLPNSSFTFTPPNQNTAQRNALIERKVRPKVKLTSSAARKLIF